MILLRYPLLRRVKTRIAFWYVFLTFLVPFWCHFRPCNKAHYSLVAGGFNRAQAAGKAFLNLCADSLSGAPATTSRGRLSPFVRRGRQGAQGLGSRRPTRRFPTKNSDIHGPKGQKVNGLRRGRWRPVTQDTVSYPRFHKKPPSRFVLSRGRAARRRDDDDQRRSSCIFRRSATPSFWVFLIRVAAFRRFSLHVARVTKAASAAVEALVILTDYARVLFRRACCMLKIVQREVATGSCNKKNSRCAALFDGQEAVELICSACPAGWRIVKLVGFSFRGSVGPAGAQSHKALHAHTRDQSKRELSLVTGETRAGKKRGKE